MKFLRGKPTSKFIGRREWWLIGNNNEAIISFNDNFRTVHIRDQNKKDITDEVAKKLKIRLDNTDNFYRLNRTIDSYFIECSEEKLDELLEKIESIL